MAVSCIVRNHFLSVNNNNNNNIQIYKAPYVKLQRR